jgi:hypothetical protein
MAGLVKDEDQLAGYQWSSLPEYLGYKEGFCHPEVVMGQFGSGEEYLKFVMDRADYMRELEGLEHLTK